MTILVHVIVRGDSSRLSPYAKITPSYSLPIIESTAVWRWQSDWDNCLANKLHSIKPCVSRWESSNHAVRKYEVLFFFFFYRTYTIYLWSSPSRRPISWMTRLMYHGLFFHIFLDCPFLEQYREVFVPQIW